MDDDVIILPPKLTKEDDGAISQIVSCDPEIIDEDIEITHEVKRLICQICCFSAAKYTCPRCGARTCSVVCVREHKARTQCSGERSRTAFVDISLYNDKDLLNDYRFLEEAERKLFNSNAPPPVLKGKPLARFMPYQISKRNKILQSAAFKRGVSLKFVSPVLTKSKNNSSYFNIGDDRVDWRVDWLFTSTDTALHDKKIPESTVLVEAARPHTDVCEHPHLRKCLESYRGSGRLEACYFLLKLEGLPANRQRYFELKPTWTLGDNLKGMCLTEYPTILVVPKSDPGAHLKYILLSKEDMPHMDQTLARHIVQHHPHLNPAPDQEREVLNPGSSIYSGAPPSPPSPSDVIVIS